MNDKRIFCLCIGKFDDLVLLRIPLLNGGRLLPNEV